MFPDYNSAAARSYPALYLHCIDSDELWVSLWGGDTSTVSPGDRCTCQSPAEPPELSPHVFPGQLTAASPPPLTAHFHWYIFKSSLLQQSANFRYGSEKTQPQIRLLCSPWEKIGIAETVKAIVVLSERGYIKMKLSQPFFVRLCRSHKHSHFFTCQTGAFSHSCTSPGAEHGYPDVPQISSTSVTNLQANFLLLTIPAQ